MEWQSECHYSWRNSPAGMVCYKSSASVTHGNHAGRTVLHCYLDMARALARAALRLFFSLGFS